MMNTADHKDSHTIIHGPCDYDNIASEKVIISNGGVFEKKYV